MQVHSAWHMHVAEITNNKANFLLIYNNQRKAVKNDKDENGWHQQYTTA